MAAYNRFITSADSLVTPHEETRAGFLRIALEKNRYGDPFVKDALAFKAMVADVNAPEELLAIPEIRPFLITAAGLSDKSLDYLTETDQMMAIQELFDKFIKPAGTNFVDEVTFRYLLIKGDTLGGKMRNIIGAFGQERLLRALFSCMNVQGMACDGLYSKKRRFVRLETQAAGAERDVKALHWANARGERLLVLNAKIPTVNKNVDICLFSGGLDAFDGGRIVRHNERALMLGELKGGIDPAGADEHWKTGNTALDRIRTNFKNAGYPDLQTSFVAAAVERSMAEEIYGQLKTGVLSNAANLTDTRQLTEYCNWMLGL